MTLINDILTRNKALFSDGAHTELRAQENRSRSVTLLSGNLTSNARSEISGMSARVYRGGLYGFSSIADISDDACRTVLRAADENSSFMASHIKSDRNAFPSVPHTLVTSKYDIADVTQKRYVDFSSELDSYIKEKCKNLTGRRVAVREDSMEKLLATSDGADGHTAIYRSYIYLFMSAESADGTPVELFSPIGGFGTFDDNFTSPDALYGEVDLLYERLMQKREGVHAEAGMKTVILGGELAGMLAHEAVGHTVEADLVQGGSVAAHSLGRQVASEKVTLVDFANTAFGKKAPLPVYIDDEGIVAEDVTLIDKGILTGYMNNRESAELFGMKPAGNARAYLFSDEPLIRMRNTAILPGSDKLEDMIASVDDGYYFIDSNNGQADMTGEFMFGVCMGYEIKHGKLGRAIFDTTISGVAFDMLKSVDMVGDTMEWSSSGFCGKKQPMPVGLGGPAIKCRVLCGGR